MNYSHEGKRIRILLREAGGLIGMIAEVKAKCNLLKLRLVRIAVADDLLNFEQEVSASTVQMKNDLDTYSRKLNVIYEELKQYGVISDME